MSTQWFLTRNGETIAQYSTEEFRSAVAKRVLKPTDFVRRSDSSTYISAAEFLPNSYTPRSAVPRILGGISAFVFAIGVFWTFAVIAGQHIFVNALQAVAAYQKPAIANGEQREALRQLLLSDTSTDNFYRALSEKDPIAFEELLTHFAGTVDATKPDEAMPEIRAYLTKSIIEPKMRDLSDADKAQMLQLNHDTSLHLASSNAQLCITQALGRPAGDIRPYLTPELTQRESQMMLRVLDATPQQVDLLPAAELQALNTKVGTALYQKHGDEISLLDLENVPQGKEEAACRMFAGYLEEVLALPETERTALIRAMMTDSSRLSQEEQPAEAPVPVTVPPAVAAPEAQVAPPPPEPPAAEAAAGATAAPSTSPDASTDGADAATQADPDGPPVDLQAQQ